ncbi:M15 family metallopeptidase [Runella sp.]|uniref:M15 family metallopeptidase n=1 Tax=Runella sp. TaxID=1960881 RepID=UPI003D0A872C
MGRVAFCIGISALMLLSIACRVVDSLTDTSSWEKERCDTTQRLESFEFIDLVLPFSQADTLKDVLVVVPRVFVTIIQNGQIQPWKALTAGSFQEHPYQLSLPADSLFLDSISALDHSYLWSLADRYDYPYNRYEPLLKAVRDSFLVKRDSMMQTYLRQYPKYKLRVQSDLRGGGKQKRHLTMGKSVAPLSQHQFGLASDIAILHKGRQLQNINYYKTFLGQIGSQYSLTWGGNFLGFVDPNHVQYFANSAELLQKLPGLRFEYEPFVRYFKNRVQAMIAAGKEAKVEDTKALLATIHDLHKGHTCVCDTLAERPTSVFVSSIALEAQKAGYQPTRDILLIGDLDNHTTSLFHPTGVQKTFKLGIWK